MTRPFDGSTTSAIVTLEGRQHHCGNLLGRIVSMKGLPRIGDVEQSVVVLNGQQDEFLASNEFTAVAALERPSDAGREKPSDLPTVNRSKP